MATVGGAGTLAFVLLALFLPHAFCETIVAKYNSTKDEQSIRCPGTIGKWCQSYIAQDDIQSRKPPRGDTPCPNDCSGVGNCNYDNGFCDCPAWRTGEDCSKPQKRPCSGIGYDKRGASSGDWGVSKCEGYCDETIGACWCDSGRYARVTGEQDASSFGAAPAQLGRPLLRCWLYQDSKGLPVTWGNGTVGKYREIYGKDGWCNADQPKYKCPCLVDGLAGKGCNVPVEHTCINQCSGHGECNLGFCKCYEGWYGTDCSRYKKGYFETISNMHTTKPFLKALITPPKASEEPQMVPTRKRPLIYVYDMPSKFNQHLLSYRIAKGECVWRNFVERNNTVFIGGRYATEHHLHELFLSSSHRTFDPEEADFFYVPVYTSCLIHPVALWSTWPAYPTPGGPRVMHASNLMQAAKQYIQGKFPWWNRRGGKDHIWYTGHDEGACWAPREIWPSIMLTHWGKLGEDHKSETTFQMDNYELDFVHPDKQPDGWIKNIKSHACYDPAKDLVIPMWKTPKHLQRSPFVGGWPVEREILLFFRGDMGQNKPPAFSRGVRQKLYKVAKKENWRDKYAIYVGTKADNPGAYSTMMSQSKFCLVLPGDGWTGRAEDAVLHGCIPVIMIKGVHMPYENIIKWEQFSLHINEYDVYHLPKLLKAVSEERIRTMQANLVQVWQRFIFSTNKLAIREFNDLRSKNFEKYPGMTNIAGSEWHGPLPGPFFGDYSENDAFQTIVMWLYGRIPDIRGNENVTFPDVNDDEEAKAAEEAAIAASGGWARKGIIRPAPESANASTTAPVVSRPAKPAAPSGALVDANGTLSYRPLDKEKPGTPDHMATASEPKQGFQLDTPKVMGGALATHQGLPLTGEFAVKTSQLVDTKLEEKAAQQANEPQASMEDADMEAIVDLFDKVGVAGAGVVPGMTPQGAAAATATPAKTPA